MLPQLTDSQPHLLFYLIGVSMRFEFATGLSNAWWNSPADCSLLREWCRVLRGARNVSLQDINYLLPIKVRDPHSCSLTLTMHPVIGLQSNPGALQILDPWPDYSPRLR